MTIPYNFTKKFKFSERGVNDFSETLNVKYYASRDILWIIITARQQLVVFVV